VAYLPQTPGFEPGQTVLDVLRQGRAPYWGAFGLESSADEKIVSDIAAMLSLTDLLHRSIEQLSGGQRQRVFIGRCLAQKPGALLLDEPSTFLDLAHQIELCQLLRDLSRKQNLAVLMATHDLNLAGAFADRLILLHRGKVASEGSPDEVLRAEVLTPVYGVEIQRIDIAGKQPVVIPALGLARE
jgi:iron complex transport system ATP-binding protein